MRSVIEWARHGIHVTPAKSACDKKKMPGGQSSSSQFVASIHARARTHAHIHMHTFRLHYRIVKQFGNSSRFEPARNFLNGSALGIQRLFDRFFFPAGVRKKRRLKINVRRWDRGGAQTCHAARV